MKKLRIIVPTILAVATLGFGALFVGAPETARAVPGPADGYDFAEDRYQAVYDQEDVKTNAEGKVRLCFNEKPVDVQHDPGDPGYVDHHAEPADVNPPSLGTCPESTIRFEAKAIHVNIDFAGNLTDPGNQPAVVVTRFHQRDGVVLQILNTEMEAIAGEWVRFTYGAASARPAASPEPEPTAPPTSTPEPPTTLAPEPGDSLLIAAGGATLPQGVTPIGEVDAGQYTADVPEGVTCYAALLSGSDTIHDVITDEGNSPTNVRGPASPVFTVPGDADPDEDGVQFDHDGDEDTAPVTVRFIHVDCAE